MRIQRKHFLSILFGKSMSVSVIGKMNNKKYNYFNYDLFNIEKRKHFKIIRKDKIIFIIHGYV